MFSTGSRRNEDHQFYDDDNSDDYDDGAADYAYAGDEQTPYIDERTMTTATPSMNMMDKHAGRHVKVENFDRPITIAFDIDVVGSPAQLAAGHVSNEWSLKKELLKRMRHNNALRNRLHATEEELEGDLRMCIPLQFEVIEHGNSQPFAQGFDVPGVMPLTFSQHGAWAHRTAAKCAVTPIREGVKMEPVNIIDRALMHDSHGTTLSDISNDIQKNEKRGYASIVVGTPAYYKLQDAVDDGTYDHLFPNGLDDDQYQAIMDPPMHRKTIEVPLAVANQLQDDISQPINDFMSRCIDLNNFVIRVVRADGQSEFDSPIGYVGEQVSADMDAEDQLSHEAANTVGQYHAKCLMTFALSKK